jgi:hypothetical protein
LHLLHPAFSQVAHLDWELDISHKRAEKYKEEPTLLLDGSIDHISSTMAQLQNMIL